MMILNLFKSISVNFLVSLLFLNASFSFGSLSKEDVKRAEKKPLNFSAICIDTIPVKVSPNDVVKLKAKGFVSYSDFGAKGDGKTDDINAIAATHEFANQQRLIVKADDGATYYISGKQQTVTIQTNTDFGSAAFIIDDTNVENRQSIVFEVTSKHQSFKIIGINSLKKNQKKINVSFLRKSVVIVTNSNKKRYIRYGLNQNNGHSQTDIFIADTKGNVDLNTPILWNFDTITAFDVFPIDEKVLKITGGNFITIANKHASEYKYYQRNILIKRSNVLIDGLKHVIVGEEDQGAPYGGFLSIKDCANITVQNTILTAHKTFHTIGSAGKPVSMGSYDIQVNRALNVLFFNCTQTNDIYDTTFWGIMASNHSKNLTYDSCVLSRFDAHMGVYNAEIRNSTIGYAGINLIGFGTFTLKNSKVYSNHLINLRRDYGSTWQGNFIILDVVFVPFFPKTSAMQ